MNSRYHRTGARVFGIMQIVFSVLSLIFLTTYYLYDLDKCVEYSAVTLLPLSEKHIPLIVSFKSVAIHLFVCLFFFFRSRYTMLEKLSKLFT